MLCHVAFFALLGYLHLWSVSAEVITVGAEDPRVLLDASFWLDASVSGCNITYWSDTPRATAIFNFTGTAVTVIGPYSGRGGVSEVYIDDKLAGTIDRYEATSKSRCDIKAFEKTGLSFTQHTLKLVLVGNSTEWDSTVFNPGTISLSEIQYTVPDTITTTSIPGTSSAAPYSTFTPINPATIGNPGTTAINTGPAVTSTGYTNANIIPLRGIAGIVTGAFVCNILLGSIA